MKRPLFWEIQGLRYNGKPEDHQLRVIAREQQALLPWTNTFPDTAEVFFATNRDWIGRMALPYLQTLLGSAQKSTQVLEIGGGEGKALLYLVNTLKTEFPSLPTALFTMTSLTSQPEQQELSAKGITLKIPQIAEALPVEWTNRFNMVLSCAVLGWADIAATIPEIKRVLAAGGYWLALEPYQNSPIYSSTSYPALIKQAMGLQQMANIVSEIEANYWANKFEQFAVVYRKGDNQNLV